MKLHVFLSNPDRWTKKASARNRFGTPVSPYNSSAISFCVLGAAEHCNTSKLQLMKLRDHLRPVPTIIAWNDHPETTHQSMLDVLKTLDI